MKFKLLQRKPYFCKNDVFYMAIDYLIGYGVWLGLLILLVNWLSDPVTEIFCKYNQYNPYSVYIAKYCHNDSTGKEMAFRRYVGSKAYFQDLEDYGIDLENTPCLFYDVHFLKRGYGCEDASLVDSTDVEYYGKNRYPTNFIQRDKESRRYARIAGVDYDKFVKNALKMGKKLFESDERNEPKYRPKYVCYDRKLLDRESLEESLRLSRQLCDEYPWYMPTFVFIKYDEFNRQWMLDLLK